jgi:hypothetical protein
MRPDDIRKDGTGPIWTNDEGITNATSAGKQDTTPANARAGHATRPDQEDRTDDHSGQQKRPMKKHAMKKKKVYRNRREKTALRNRRA